MLGFFGARMDAGGLGWQSYAMVRMLRPDKLLAIDSSVFTKDTVQDYSRYDGFDGYLIRNWPTNKDCLAFLKTGVTSVFMCETPYNLALYSYAKIRNVKTYCQPNYEFLDAAVNKAVPHPTKYLAPSYWMLEEMIGHFGEDMVQYLPPPTFPSDFKEARETNFNRTGRRRFLHIIGRAASKDRNGTESVLEALKSSHEDFELVIRSQHPVPELIALSDDRRITWDARNIPDQGQVFKDFDALIMPRRYGGLCLPANEALMSGLPVIMTDISPNNRVLPAEWLVPANVQEQLMARMLLDVYSADPQALASKLDWLATLPAHELSRTKIDAFEIGHSNYSPDVLRPKYEALLV